MYALLIYLSLHSLLFVEDLSKEGNEEGRRRKWYADFSGKTNYKLSAGAQLFF